MKIAQINTFDIYGGAAKIAWDLWKGYSAHGNASWLVVGEKRSRYPGIFEIPRLPLDNRPLYRFIGKLHRSLRPLDGRVRGFHRLRNYLYDLSGPAARQNRLQGLEDFDHPGSWALLDGLPGVPDLIQAHNLHGGYFDLRLLPSLSQRFPLVLTLHDAWMLSGHCAHSLDCPRWKFGCGSCPDLTIYPAIAKDATAENWQRKQQIYHQSHLYVTTPSQWLMDKVSQSILQDGLAMQKVIPNGIDLTIFTPGDREHARRQLGIPAGKKVMTFVSSDIKRSHFKDFNTLKEAIKILGERWQGDDLLILAMGESGKEEVSGSARIRYLPFENDPLKVAVVYRAADLYVHAARAETFPNTIIEAMACGTPVIASDVGGIPEQITHQVNGILVPPGSALALAGQIDSLLHDAGLRSRLAEKASQDTALRFDVKRQVKEYLTWFEEVILDWRSQHEE